jgi:xylulokinase
MTAVLTLDAGTSALKAVLFSATGRILSMAEEGYGPPPAPHRQDQDAWWRAAATACRRLGGPRPEAVALTGTMENLIPVRADGSPAGPAVLYSDPMGGTALAEAADDLARARAASILGNPPEPLMTAFKLARTRRDDPAAIGAARWILASPKDALALRMTGVASADPVSASTTGLMDMRRRDWSGELLAATGTDAGLLPPIRPAAAVLGPLRAEPAAALGLPAGIPVFNGCGDAGATTVGSGCDSDGDISLHLGTTGWVARVVGDDGIGEPRPVYRLAHPDDGLVIEVTPILSAGAATAWARGILGLDGAAAEAALADSDRDPPDLVFLPYLIGERSPFEDTTVRGAFIGLDAGHRAPALFRAVIEGVSFAIRASLSTLDDRPDLRIRVVGGGGASAHWPQILADVLGRTVERIADPAAATARGAFAIAARGLGLPGGTVDAVETLAPRAGTGERIARLARVFEDGTAFARAAGRSLGR